MLQVYDHMMTHKISETWCSTCWLNFELPLVIVLKLNWWHKLLWSIVVPSVYKMVIFTSCGLYTYITPLPGDYLIFKYCVWWSILCLGSCLSLHYNLSQVSCWRVSMLTLCGTPSTTGLMRLHKSLLDSWSSGACFAKVSWLLGILYPSMLIISNAYFWMASRIMTCILQNRY